MHPHTYLKQRRKDTHHRAISSRTISETNSNEKALLLGHCDAAILRINHMFQESNKLRAGLRAIEP
jgi:hypothetical protein